MKKTTVFAVLSLAFAANTFAAEPIEQSLTKGLIVAVTEPGKVAADTAWLLSDQAAEGRDVPILLVLAPETRERTLNALELDRTELPALVYLDSNGKERSRVIRAAPTAKVFAKTGINTTALN